MASAGTMNQTPAQDFRKALEALKPHDHACLIYGSHKEWRNTVIPFIAIGLREGEKCIYVTDAHTTDEIRRSLKAFGVKAASVEKTGQLLILQESQAYTRGGVFDPGKMIRLLKKETKQALNEGYTALRFSSEMTWILKGLPGTERLLEYSARLNSNLFERYPCVAICQYDVRRFDPDIIKIAVMTHPIVVRRYAIYRNFYCTSPKEFLSPKRHAIEVGRWLTNLEREAKREAERNLTGQKLRQSEERFRSVVEDQTEVICRFTIDGTFTFVNDVYCRFFGKSSEELLRTKWKPIVFSDDLPAVERQLDALSPANPVVVIENRVYAADGRVCWMQFVNRAFFDTRGRLIEIQSVGRDITERKRAEIELKTSRQQMRALASHLQEVREEERTRISREIHDELGQSLTGIKIDVSWLRERLTNEGRVTGAMKERVDSLIALIDATIQATRTMSLSLRPGILDDLGIAAALAWQVRQFQGMTGVGCTYFADVERTDISETLATALFRICQECLTNVTRHADATAVYISLTEEAGNLILEVEDNGRGITEEQAGSSTALGIMGMRERILNLGGTFTIHGNPGLGTKVRVEVRLA